MEETSLFHRISNRKCYYISGDYLYYYTGSKQSKIKLVDRKNITLNFKKLIKFFSLSDFLYVFQIDYEIFFVKFDSSKKDNNYEKKILDLRDHLDFKNFLKKEDDFQVFHNIPENSLDSENVDVFNIYAENSEFKDIDFICDINFDSSVKINDLSRVFLNCDLSKLILYDFLKDEKKMITYEYSTEELVRIYILESTSFNF